MTATDRPELFSKWEFPKLAFHMIEIKVPLPDGSMAEKAQVLAGYEAEMKAFFAKLPAGTTSNDYFSRPRETPTKRKTMDERLAEMAKKQGLSVVNGKIVVPAAVAEPAAEAHRGNRQQHASA